MIFGGFCLRIPSVMQLGSRRYHSKSPLYLVYFGSDQYALAHLQALIDRESSLKNYRIQHVVTANDATPVASYCTKTGLDYSTWPRGSNECAKIVASRVKDWQNDLARVHPPSIGQKQSGILGLVISFGRFLPTPLIAAFGQGCVNIHPSLLPRWRGPCPLLHTLLAGDTVSGISAIRLPADEHAFDTGPVLQQRAIQLDTRRPLTPSQLGDFLTPYSIEVMFEIIGRALTGNLSEALSQSALAKRCRLIPADAPRPNEAMGHVDWANQTASEIVRLWYCLSETPVHLTSPLQIRKPTSTASDAIVRFVGQNPVAVPLDDPSEASSRCQPNDLLLLQNAAYLLQRVPHEFPPGGVMYLRAQNQRNYPLVPFAFIACKPHVSFPKRSWLAVPSLHIRMPGARHFRPLTALDVYNGVLHESESRKLSSMYDLPHGFHPFSGFRSLSNPLTSKIEYRAPLRDTVIISLVNKVIPSDWNISAPSGLALDT
ncbi:Methionyl-tRNA formyltransferase mitochondrial [Fasciola hepatica]|uniref:Methionyl-tRNA formyltransferase mitochondrial n=1 Tax=Fasciola hepatica TaxID=6192 RepID=A0A4E0QYA1_FASHE|nr:Methionyl-tRNA formyltransferase mitochondrial [Fasciola hepatica]